uniref:Uncharacterized protein n=1 Tax=Pristionchus pacificus TaxID=54126 RepID=A0A2A6BSX4_PRIPA|eukprot:PDM69072.1 hypothetical protein PRIPAC_47374 [Pristionchus pacificus]
MRKRYEKEETSNIVITAITKDALRALVETRSTHGKRHQQCGQRLNMWKHHRNLGMREQILCEVGGGGSKIGIGAIDCCRK